MYSKFGQFIDGKWQQSEKKETYDVINPATEEILGKASKATSVDVEKALKSAEKGFAIWKKTLWWVPEWVTGEAREPGGWTDAACAADAVFHLAAAVGVLVFLICVSFLFRRIRYWLLRPFRWLNRSPSSCGNVSKNSLDRRSNRPRGSATPASLRLP